MKINKDLRHKLVPQMKIYDALDFQFLPHLMFTQSPNFRSKVINTDSRGFRFSTIKRKKGVFNIDKKKKSILILGGSTAFGVGASKDEKTITGILEKKTKYNFLNLAGRGYSGLQESISLISNIDEISTSNIKKIIIFSGLNDLYLNSSFVSRYPGMFYFYSNFISAMNNYFFSFKKRIMIKIINFFLLIIGDQNDYDFKSLNRNNFINFILSKKFRKVFLNKKRYEKLKLPQIINRNFRIYKSLEKTFNCKVIFVFQPILKICKNPSIEEKKLLNYSEIYFADENKRLNRFLSKSLYKRYTKLFENISRKNKIKYFDSNIYLKNKNLSQETLFVDNVHLNDKGNEIISRYLSNLINK
tara:strand:- start:1373 stop:2446 length:1074 start_codon:yes stop_codon:yes gene_type:complete